MARCSTASPSAGSPCPRARRPTEQQPGSTAQLDVRASPESTGDGFSAYAVMTVEALDLRGATKVRVPSGRLELQAHRLVAAPASPARVAGDVSLTVALKSLAAETGQLRAAAEKLGLDLAVPLPQRAPFALKADLPLGSLRVTDASGKRLLSAPARLHLELEEAAPQLTALARSTAASAGSRRARRTSSPR